MPLVYQQNINEATRMAVWHITEEETFFLGRLPLPSVITHPQKRLQHLAGRYLLSELYDNFPIELIRIADTRKPYLPDEVYHFSISHCGHYAAALVSHTSRVGVDIEIVSEKVLRLKDKFLSEPDQLALHELIQGEYPLTQTQVYTLAWSVKETIFKWIGSGAVDFKNHIHINRAVCNDNQFTILCMYDKQETTPLTVHGLFFNGNFLTWLVN